jgi:hypothetical protein
MDWLSADLNALFVRKFNDLHVEKRLALISPTARSIIAHFPLA